MTLVDEAVRFFEHEAWDQQVTVKGGMDEILWHGDPADLRSQGARMVRAYCLGPANRVEPEEIEYEFHVDVPGVPIPVLGYIDIVQANERPSIDLKTVKKKQTNLSPDWVLQGRIYQLAVPRPIDWHLITKNAEPQVFTGLEEPGLMQHFALDQNRTTERHIYDLAWRANAYYLKYGPDEDWPALGINVPKYFKTVCDYCGYFHNCPAWPKI